MLKINLMRLMRQIAARHGGHIEAGRPSTPPLDDGLSALLEGYELLYERFLQQNRYVSFNRYLKAERKTLLELAVVQIKKQEHVATTVQPRPLLRFRLHQFVRFLMQPVLLPDMPSSLAAMHLR